MKLKIRDHIDRLDLTIMVRIYTGKAK